jgi:hypothetical protein
MAGIGGMTYAELRTELDQMIRNTWDGSRDKVTPAFIAEWVNLGYQEVDRKLRWTRCDYQWETEAEEPEYTVPCEVREVLAVTYTDLAGKLTRLEVMDMDDWIDARVSSDTSGTPRQYMQHGDKFYLYPKPAASVEVVMIYIVTEPPNLSKDADRPGFPAHLHSRILDLAFCKALRLFSRFTDAVNLEAFVDEQLMRERKEPAARRASGNRARPPNL